MREHRIVGRAFRASRQPISASPQDRRAANAEMLAACAEARPTMRCSRI